MLATNQPFARDSFSEGAPDLEQGASYCPDQSGLTLLHLKEEGILGFKVQTLNPKP